MFALLNDFLRTFIEPEAAAATYQCPVPFDFPSDRSIRHWRRITARGPPQPSLKLLSHASPDYSEVLVEYRSAPDAARLMHLR